MSKLNRAIGNPRHACIIFRVLPNGDRFVNTVWANKSNADKHSIVLNRRGLGNFDVEVIPFCENDDAVVEFVEDSLARLGL